MTAMVASSWFMSKYHVSTYCANQLKKEEMTSYVSIARTLQEKPCKTTETSFRHLVGW